MEISMLINKKHRWVNLDVLLNNIQIADTVVDFNDKTIRQAVFTERYVIFTLLDQTNKIYPNNIEAYYLDGRYAWNISKIVTDQNACYGGCNVSTAEIMNGFFGFDATLYHPDHELLTCQTWEGAYYVIDLQEERIIQKLWSK